MDNVIEINGLSKNFAGRYALKNVNWSVPKGKIIGLVGPNGAGKTTLLRSVLGLIPSKGKTKVLGLEPFKNRAKLMEDVAFIGDTASLPKWMRVNDLLHYLEGVHPNFDILKAHKLVATTDIPASAKIKTLSKGMMVQLHLAIVMSIDAKLLVLDEPTLGLDIVYRKYFYEQLLADYFDHNRTIIITTHQVEEVESILTDVAMIRKGEIVLESSIDTLEAQYTEVLVPDDARDELRALAPLHERKVLGGTAMIFKLEGNSIEHPAIISQSVPALADLFVAIHQWGGPLK